MPPLQKIAHTHIHTLNAEDKDKLFLPPILTVPFFRRQYSAGARNSTYRKSTNPFVEDFEVLDTSSSSSNSNRPSLERQNSYEEADESAFVSGLPQRSAPVPQVSQKKPQPHLRYPPSSSSSRPKSSYPVETRPRRSNSDSSLMEPQPRHRSSKEDSSSSSSSRAAHKSSSRHHHHSDKSEKHSDKSHSRKHRSKKPNQAVDVIDKLDVSGYLGVGSFHHDGPFDACNPHRNKNSARAPVQAFPVDGANNSLRGGDPVNDSIHTENVIMGRNADEAYLDYNSGRRPSANGNGGASGLYRPNVPDNGIPRAASARPIDAKAKADPVHGDVSLGLGSSTFLDGTPASKEAILKSQEEGGASGLGRKKSLVQKLRGDKSMGPPRPIRPSAGRQDSVGSAENYVVRTSSNPVSPNSWSPEKKALGSVDARPVDTNGSSAFGNGSAAGSSSSAVGNGFLRRVKSLKVGSRRRS